MFVSDERRALNAILIGINLGVLNQFTGVFTLLTYAGNILAKTGTSTVRPYTSTIILGVFHNTVSRLPIASL